MTWGEFKKYVDERVTDEMKIDYIDISYPHADHISVTHDYETFCVID